MKPFLQRLAEDIAGRFGDDPGQVCVVLPNRRAGLYLKKYLSQILKSTAWAPQTYAVEDFITMISGYPLIDQASLLFELYAVHRELNGAGAQDFDVFSDWGQILLQDFDEIDQYLVDPAKIFGYLNEARAITVWNLGEKPLTEHEKSYLEFYRSFREYYERLNARLLQKRMPYRGMAYRLAAENIAGLAARFPWKKIFLAGLNAMTSAEEVITDHLVRSGRAELFWDADPYYLDDREQEAGEFIRKYLQQWPGENAKWVETHFKHSEKEIHVYGVPMNLGQAVKAGELIRGMRSADTPPDHLALVLADEKLLLPVLYQLPPETGPVNVTMGYPFRYTNLYNLVHLLFRMQENREMFETQRKEGQGGFYSRDVLKVLAHPYLFYWEDSAGEGNLSAWDMASAIRARNRVFLRPGELPAIIGGCREELQRFLREIFTPWLSPADAITGLQSVTGMLRDRILIARAGTARDADLDIEYLFLLSRVLTRCRAMVEEYPFAGSLKALRKVLSQVIDSLRLPFYGEPLTGLQVMGVLETRAVDFENLVVLSVNEGVLPSGRQPNSFIPFDIKIEFGLPTYRQKDAVFAYHFYRMLQRAKKVFLLYDTEGDKLKGGEKSRFITQIAYELPRHNSGIRVYEELLSPPPPAGDQDLSVSAGKSDWVMEKLEARAVKGFSPSSLNTFILCPLKFYYQEIAGIEEAEEIEETIEARTMGTVVHQVLQKVYQAFGGKFVDPERLSESLPLTESLLKEAFEQHYRGGDVAFGKNHLVYTVSHYLVRQFIRAETDRLNESDRPAGTLQVIALEEPLESTLKCELHGVTREIRIRGKADRIDRWNGVTRIIDYKTGYVDRKELKLDSFDDLIDKPEMSKAFQLLVYAWLYRRADGRQDEAVESGNMTLRRISEGFMKVELPGGQAMSREVDLLLEDRMVELFGRIFDPQQPFTQTGDPENCEYCPFRAICTR